MGRECEVTGKRRAKSVEGWWGWGKGGKGEALRTLSVMSIIFFSRIMEHKPCRLLS